MCRSFASVVASVVVSSILLAGCVASRVAGDALGGGFTRTPEGRLDHRGADLGAVDFVSVSPSGAQALFERDGKLLLFATGPGNLRDVTPDPWSPPVAARWDEAAGVVEVDLEDGRPALRLELTRRE